MALTIGKKLEALRTERTAAGRRLPGTAEFLDAVRACLALKIAPALKPDARIGIVDSFAPTPKHGTPPNLLRCELGAVGYREVSFDPLKGSDAYLAIFAPPSVASRTRPEDMVTCRQPD